MGRRWRNKKQKDEGGDGEGQDRRGGGQGRGRGNLSQSRGRGGARGRGRGRDGWRGRGRGGGFFPTVRTYNSTTDDTITPEGLEKLRQEPLRTSLVKMFQSSQLREKIKELDQAKNPQVMINHFMQDEQFAEFSRFAIDNLSEHLFSAKKKQIKNSVVKPLAEEAEEGPLKPNEAVVEIPITSSSGDSKLISLVDPEYLSLD